MTMKTNPYHPQPKSKLVARQCRKLGIKVIKARSFKLKPEDMKPDWTIISIPTSDDWVTRWARRPMPDINISTTKETLKYCED